MESEGSGFSGLKKKDRRQTWEVAVLTSAVWKGKTGTHMGNSGSGVRRSIKP